MDRWSPIVIIACFVQILTEHAEMQKFLRLNYIALQKL